MKVRTVNENITSTNVINAIGKSVFVSISKEQYLHLYTSIYLYLNPGNVYLPASRYALLVAVH